MNLNKSGMSETSAKQRLAAILNEDNIKTNKGSLVVNILIIALIVVSAIQIIIEVDPKFSKYEGLFEWADLIIITIFTVEYLLRVWTSDVEEEKYQGTAGKFRYIFSFYALIDLIAILPYYISLLFVGPSLAALRVLRVIRILKLARFMKSFDFIVKATKNKKSELMISMQVVILLTFVLSVLLYNVENEAQPDNFSTIWSSMLWSFSKFIGDVGGYGDFTPVTPVGMALATGVGILSIAIFAVPAGIIASGFVEEIEGEKKANEINEKVAILESSFAATKNNHLGMKVPRRKRTLPEIKSRLIYSDNEIFEAVRNSNKMRIKWEKSDPDLKVADMIVVEHYEPNTLYGVNRQVEGSKIHIINPIGKGERGISHFANTLAKYGGYNLISNEIFSGGEILKENKFRLDINPQYSKDKIEGPQGALDFCNDINSQVSKNDWVIILRTSAGHREHDLHILFGGKKGDVTIDQVEIKTVDDISALTEFVTVSKESFAQIGHKVCTHEDFKNESPNLLHQYVRKHTGANVLTIFISVDVVSGENRIYYPFMKELRNSIGKLDS
jgi:voltage-gated potassium channel